MFQEFRNFISRGNVLELAVGVIIGGAFTAIVNSLVNDVINPLIGLLVGGRADFSNYFLPLAGQTATTLVEARTAGPVLAYGAFFSAVLNFLLVALVVFVLMRITTRLLRAAISQAEQPEIAAVAPAAVQPQAERMEQLLAEIRDILAAGQSTGRADDGSATPRNSR